MITLAPRKFECGIRLVSFKLILVIDAYLNNLNYPEMNVTEPYW